MLINIFIYIFQHFLGSSKRCIFPMKFKCGQNITRKHVQPSATSHTSTPTFRTRKAGLRPIPARHLLLLNNCRPTRPPITHCNRAPALPIRSAAFVLFDTYSASRSNYRTFSYPTGNTAGENQFASPEFGSVTFCERTW